jgi:hypothetical protein
LSGRVHLKPMYRRPHATTPSQLAINGALDLFVEGGTRNNPKQMLVGLTVLQDGTAEQLAAVSFPFRREGKGRRHPVSTTRTAGSAAVEPRVLGRQVCPDWPGAST